MGSKVSCRMNDKKDGNAKNFLQNSSKDSLQHILRDVLKDRDIEQQTNLKINSGINPKTIRKIDQKIGDVIPKWLNDLPNLGTRNTYRHGFNAIVKAGLIDLNMSLEQFAVVDFSIIINEIHKMQECSKNTLTCRIAVMINLIDWLRFYTGDESFVIKRNRFSKLFIRANNSKVSTQALTHNEIINFLVTLIEQKPIFGVIACLCYSGAKRINEVLALRACDINKEQQIIFHQSKRHDGHHTIVTVDRCVFEVLNELIHQRNLGPQDFIFKNISGTKISREYVYKQFKTINEKITPHVLRVSAITNWREQGVPLEEIIKVSGHKSYTALLAYDKSTKSNNPTLTHSLLSS